MKMRELVTNMNKPPHMHARWTVKDNRKKTNEENHKTYRMGNFSIESVLDEFKSRFVFIEYQQHYAQYVNEGTEYIRFEATLAEGYSLTCDVFSCYCEPLNEKQDPPF